MTATSRSSSNSASLPWLLVELCIGIVACSAFPLVAGEVTGESLSKGVILAFVILAPAEGLRQLFGTEKFRKIASQIHRWHLFPAETKETMLSNFRSIQEALATLTVLTSHALGKVEGHLDTPTRVEPRQDSRTAPDLASYWGTQLVLDCYGVLEEVCCDLDHMYEFLEGLSIFLKETKETQPYVFKTCERAFPGRPGVTGWLPLTESSIEIHTSANNRFVAVDISLRRELDPAAVEQFVAKWLNPITIRSQYLFRGAKMKELSFPYQHHKMNS